MTVAEGGRVSRQRGGPAQSRGPAGLGTPGEDRPALRGRLAASCLPGEWPGLEARPPCGRGGGPERWTPTRVTAPARVGGGGRRSGEVTAGGGARVRGAGHWPGALAGPARRACPGAGSRVPCPASVARCCGISGNVFDLQAHVQGNPGATSPLGVLNEPGGC